jgi:cysteine synthase A
MSLLRLFNEPQGKALLAATGVADDTIRSLPLLGISGIANLLASIKLARACALGEDDLVVTVLTDSLDLYRSRLAELTEAEGPFDREAAIRAHAASLAGQGADNVLELTERERRRIHNLKYYTWVEQQGRSVEDLDAQWDDPGSWRRVQQQAPRIDELIAEFNREVGIVR